MPVLNDRRQGQQEGDLEDLLGRTEHIAGITAEQPLGRPRCEGRAGRSHSKREQGVGVREEQKRNEAESGGDAKIGSRDALAERLDLCGGNSARIGQGGQHRDGSQPPAGMSCNQGRRPDARRQARQRQNLRARAEAERQHPIGAKQAVFQDRKPRLARGAAHAIEEIGKSVLVQAASNRGARRHGQKRRQYPMPELGRREEDRRTNRADKRAGQRKIFHAALDPSIREAAHLRHRQAREHLNRKQEIEEFSAKLHQLGRSPGRSAMVFKRPSAMRTSGMASAAPVPSPSRI